MLVVVAAAAIVSAEELEAQVVAEMVALVEMLV
jgi:hypothetical protein